MYVSFLEHSQLPAQWALGNFTPENKAAKCEIEPSGHLVPRSNYVKLTLHFEIGFPGVIHNKAHEQFYL